MKNLYLDIDGVLLTADTLKKTMHSLVDLHGYVNIPKGTLLYRGHKDSAYNDCMFFATNAFVAGAFDNNIQIWETTKDIQVLFLVEYLNKYSHAISSLPRLFNTLFPFEPNSSLDDLDIKHWDIDRRNKLIQHLFEKHSIAGWFTSLENMADLEVCLFDSRANAQQISLIENTKKVRQNLTIDSLKEFDFFLPQDFYKRTLEVIGEGNIGDTNPRYNLRTKLNI